MTEAKLVGFREQVADCGLLKPVTVGEEVYQATANDAKASGAVDSLVRHISMLQAAIRHLLSLLETAVEKAGGGTALLCCKLVVVDDVESHSPLFRVGAIAC